MSVSGFIAMTFIILYIRYTVLRFVNVRTLLLSVSIKEKIGEYKT